jgi:hypothetical protein
MMTGYHVDKKKNDNPHLYYNVPFSCWCVRGTGVTGRGVSVAHAWKQYCFANGLHPRLKT